MDGPGEMFEEEYMIQFVSWKEQIQADSIASHHRAGRDGARSRVDGDACVRASVTV